MSKHRRIVPTPTLIKHMEEARQSYLDSIYSELYGNPVPSLYKLRTPIALLGYAFWQDYNLYKAEQVLINPGTPETVSNFLLFILLSEGRELSTLCN